MEKNAELKESVRKVLGSQKVAVLSTHGEEFPHACLVAYDFTEDLARLTFATSRSSHKYDNIQRDSRASILVDTCTNDETDFNRGEVASAQGTIRELSGDTARLLGSRFLNRHPYLEDFLRAPTTVQMVMDVRTYALVSRFQEVLILDMGR
jgi:nitroimidazol reductase NimA-like FMN-containing flavoprotein (pyridoxamine 5'-phosphate oxidase superfamily)